MLDPKVSKNNNSKDKYRGANEHLLFIIKNKHMKNNRKQLSQPNLNIRQFTFPSMPLHSWPQRLLRSHTYSVSFV